MDAAKAIVEAGVAVMGHVGLTPQSVSVLGERAAGDRVCDHTLGLGQGHVLYTRQQRVPERLPGSGQLRLVR